MLSTPFRSSLTFDEVPKPGTTAASPLEREQAEQWAEWLLAVQNGDDTHYAELLTQLAAYVRAYLIRKFGASDSIEDYVQESLIAIHSARHTYDASRPLKPWVQAIVRHRTIDCLRRGRDHEPLDIDETLSADTPDPSIHIDSETVLGDLTDSLRQPLYLTKIMGLSNRECADQLGLSESAVRVRVFRALQQLRLAWKANGP